jgi:hypothetical protein
MGFEFIKVNRHIHIRIHDGSGLVHTVVLTLSRSQPEQYCASERGAAAFYLKCSLVIPAPLALVGMTILYSTPTLAKYAWRLTLNRNDGMHRHQVIVFASTAPVKFCARILYSIEMALYSNVGPVQVQSIYKLSWKS